MNCIFYTGKLVMDNVLGDVYVTVNFIWCDCAYVHMFWYVGVK